MSRSVSIARPLSLASRLFYRSTLFVLVLWAACQAPGSKVSESHPRYAAQAKRIEHSRIHFQDGDTFSANGLTIRMLGMDSPEIASPEYGYFEDQPYGRQAAELARKLLQEARVVEYVPFRNDRYDRLLAHVFVDGELLAAKMIQAGLAYETVSFYGDNGFPDLAREIKLAAEKAGRPQFEEPYLWRREHRRGG